MSESSTKVKCVCASQRHTLGNALNRRMSISLLNSTFIQSKVYIKHPTTMNSSSRTKNQGLFWGESSRAITNCRSITSNRLWARSFQALFLPISYNSLIFSAVMFTLSMNAMADSVMHIRFLFQRTIGKSKANHGRAKQKKIHTLNSPI